LRQFHAKPLPDMYRDTTKPMPYRLRVDSRGQEKGKKLDEKVSVVSYVGYFVNLF